MFFHIKRGFWHVVLNLPDFDEKWLQGQDDWPGWFGDLSPYLPSSASAAMPAAELWYLLLDIPQGKKVFSRHFFYQPLICSLLGPLTLEKSTDFLMGLNLVYKKHRWPWGSSPLRCSASGASAHVACSSHPWLSVESTNGKNAQVRIESSQT